MSDSDSDSLGAQKDPFFSSLTVAFGVWSSFGSADLFPRIQTGPVKNLSGTFSPVLAVQRFTDVLKKIGNSSKVVCVFVKKVKSSVRWLVGSLWNPKFGCGYWFSVKVFPGVVLRI